MYELANETRLRGVWQQMRHALRTRSPSEAARFDCIGMCALGYMLSKRENGPELQLSASELADELGICRTTARNRLMTMAAYSLITVTPGQRDAGGQRRFCLNVRVSPLLDESIAKGTLRPRIKHLVDRWLEVGLLRAQGTQSRQGFHSHVPYGEREPTLTPGLQMTNDVSGELFDLAAARADEQALAPTDAKALRAAERARDDAFVDGAARAWTGAMVANGKMKATERLAPAWAGAVADLSPAHKHERADLVKIFRQYGGNRTGIAWLYFTQSQPLLDTKTNRPQFRPEIPHLQWVSSDKKPSHFAKHFNAIMTDPVFRENLLKSSWNDLAKKIWGELATSPHEDDDTQEARA